MTSIFREMLNAKVISALASAKSLSQVKHRGLKGSLREVVVRDLLAPLLPHSAGLAQGEIIDSRKGVSNQQDIVIYDRQLTPALLIDRHSGIVPIESALYTIEVKSKTSRTEVEAAMNNAKSVNELVGAGESSETEKTIPCLFSFDSDLSGDGKTELERYQEIDTRKSPYIRSICVVGKGYWYFKDSSWNMVSSTDTHDEVIQFMAGILDTYRRVVSTRKTRSFSQYLR